MNDDRVSTDAPAAQGACCAAHARAFAPQRLFAAVASSVLALALALLPLLSGAQAYAVLASASVTKTGPALAAGSAIAPAGGEPLAVQAGNRVSSGSASQGERTAAAIKAAWDSIPEQPLGTDIFEAVNDNDVYAPATLSEEALAYAEAYLNFIRYSAGLSPITFDDALNANAAQGALILSKLGNGLSHYPATPAGVSEAQAAPGKYACATSNISYSSATYPDRGVLQIAIQGQIDDSSSNNLSTLGHRRWLLNPAASTMGIGSAYADARPWHTFHSAIRVFTNPFSGLYDPSYGEVGSAGATDYEFVAWPASGMFANNVFSMGTPWSITLNAAAYAPPSADVVRVTVTRLSDNASWVMTGADTMPSREKKYLLVENSGYGVPNCIIFNPGSDNVGMAAYDGVYRVDVSGLETRAGEPASLSYEVEFVDANALADEPYTPEPARSMAMSRLYNPWSGEHHYTNDPAEISDLTTLGWRDEGTAWRAPATGSPVWRLYNPWSGDHHFTTDESEYRRLGTLGWRKEGVGFYSGDALTGRPVYRGFNPYVAIGTHHYTVDRQEMDGMADAGWVREGVGWYGVAG